MVTCSQTSDDLLRCRIYLHAVIPRFIYYYPSDTFTTTRRFPNRKAHLANPLHPLRFPLFPLRRFFSLLCSISLDRCYMPNYTRKLYDIKLSFFSVVN